MNCELCRSELEDFLYGELSESRAGEIRTHLAGCPSCASAHESLERENELFASYYERTASEPSAELWNAIRDRIRSEAVSQQEKRAGWFAAPAGGAAARFLWLLRPSLLRQAAYSLLLVALTVALTTWVLKRGKEVQVVEKEVPAASGNKQPGPTPVPVPTAKHPDLAVRRTPHRVRRLTGESVNNKQIGEQIARAEREYRHAIRLLDSAIASRKEGLDPELLKQYENSLALIDSSIAASRLALRERPNDLAAGQFLLAAYARKVELMQEFSMR